MHTALRTAQFGVVPPLGRCQVPAAIVFLFISAEAIDDMLKSGTTDRGMPQLEHKSIHFLCVAVDGATDVEMGERIGIAVDVAARHHWCIPFVCSNFAVFVEFGAITHQPLQTALPVLVDALQRACGPSCKSLGGQRVAAWGQYGSATRCAYGPLFPDFLQLVAALERMPFGSHVELDGA